MLGLLLKAKFISKKIVNGKPVYKYKDDNKGGSGKTDAEKAEYHKNKMQVAKEMKMTGNYGFHKQEMEKYKKLADNGNKKYTYKRDSSGAFDIPSADKPQVISSNPEFRKQSSIDMKRNVAESGYNNPYGGKDLTEKEWKQLQSEEKALNNDPKSKSPLKDKLMEEQRKRKGWEKGDFGNKK